MPITPTLTVDPVKMTNNWSAALGSPVNVAKLIDKYNHPKVAFNANPTQAQQAWNTGIQRAMTANKYANGMAAANLDQASTNMTNYGGNNWSQSGTSKKYKYQAISVALAAAINAVAAQVAAMPKGKGANNQARMNAWFTGMSAYYGKIKK